MSIIFLITQKIFVKRNEKYELVFSCRFTGGGGFICILNGYLFFIIPFAPKNATVSVSPSAVHK